MPIVVDELNDTNCKTYLLRVGSEAALVDPVRERIDTYRQLLAREGLTLRLVLETHTYPLAQANVALDDLRAGRFSGAAVLLPRS